MRRMWTVKYKPKNLKEFVNQKEAVEAFLKWIKSWRHGKALLFYGPPGTGKTTLIQAYAFENKLDLIELNASDYRSASQIKEILGESVRQQSLFRRGKIFMIDECLDYNSSVVINSNDYVRKISIGHLVENESPNHNIKILSVNEKGNLIFIPILKFIKIPHNLSNGFYKIRIHNGREIKVTGNHRILTIDDWEEAENIGVGDLVLAKQNQFKRKKYKELNKKINFKIKFIPNDLDKFILKSSEIKIIKILAMNPNGLTINQISKLSKLRRQIISASVADRERNYISLKVLNLVTKERKGSKCIIKLKTSKEKALTIFYKEKIERRKNILNKKIINKLKNYGLLPLRKKHFLIFARLTGHIFGDGSFVLTDKTKSAFFSGKKEDIKKIRLDLKNLGFHVCGKIRKNRWKNGEVWSTHSNDRALHTILYSLGCPIGRKTDIEYKIPNWILVSDKDIKREFISSFFGSEGFKPSFQKDSIKPILITQRKTEKLKNNLEYFLLQLKRLLKEFNIKSTVRIDTKNKITRKDGTKTIIGYLILKNSISNSINFLERIGYTYCKYKGELAINALKYLKWKRDLGRFIYRFRPLPYFNEWIKRYQKGKFTFFFVTEIKKIKDPGYVYCITTQNNKFLANDIVVHNCDGLVSREDQGGVGEIIDIIKKSRFPIILTANNPYNPKLRTLRQYCLLVQFKKIVVWDIEKRLQQICDNEKIKVRGEVLRKLAQISKGDLRSAINDLESLSQGKTSITERDLEFLSTRERETSIFDALKIIFKSKSVLGAKLSINNVDKDPDEIFWWIENNIANEYEDPREIARAYDALSKADLFRQRINLRQNWRFKAYMIDLMTGGVATSKKEMYRKFTRYQYPSKLIVLGMTKESRAETKEVLSKLSQQLHCSTKKIRKEFLPFIPLMIKDIEFRKSFLESFNLTSQDLKLLIH